MFNTNTTTTICTLYPGGVGDSGVGCYRGKHSLDAFTYKRSIMRRDDKAILDAPVRYPPYTKFGLDLFLTLGKLPPIYPMKDYFRGSWITTLLAGGAVVGAIALLIIFG